MNTEPPLVKSYELVALVGQSTKPRLARLLPILLLWMLPLLVHAQFNYTINNGRVTITGYTGPGGNVVIPDTIGGLPVTSIGSSAFYHKLNVTGVLLPDSVTSIGNSAFAMCWNLAGIAIPDGVTSIGWSAFYHCVGLTHITIGSGVTSIGDAAFRSCLGLNAITVDELNSAFSSVDGVLFDKNQALLIQYPGGKAGSYAIPDGVTAIAEGAFNLCAGLTSVDIPDSVTNIGDSAFGDCAALVSVTLSRNVTEIGDGVFGHCTGLSSINIPHGVTSIGNHAFLECTSLNNVLIPDSVLTIGMSSFGGCTGLTGLTIPGSVTSIGEGAFMDCTALKSVTIGNGVTSVGVFAFFGCTQLARVTIPESVTSIDVGAFAGCNSLTAIDVDPSNPSYSSVDGVLFDAIQSTLIQFPGGRTGSYSVPGGVSSIGTDAFWNCGGLTSVNFPGSLTSIGWEAFWSCTGLTTLTVPGSVIRIHGFSFWGCTGLIEATIGSGLTALDWGAFDECANLTSVFFEGNAPELGEGGDIFGVFQNTPATIYYMSGTTGWGPTFSGRPTVMIVPDADRDGIPDAEDCCRFSDLSGTVVIGGRDSGVPNAWFPSGCTISDHIAVLAGNARNHGKFVNGVADYLNELKKAGVISGAEKGAIQSCAAKAAIP